jgi:hypothetical protein
MPVDTIRRPRPLALPNPPPKPPPRFMQPGFVHPGSAEPPRPFKTSNQDKQPAGAVQRAKRTGESGTARSVDSIGKRTA